MPATFGIVYATGSKMVRRIISNSQNLSLHAGPGESILTIQQANAPTLFQAEAAILAATGVQPAQTLCAIVDAAGAIADIVKADPAIDTVAQHSLIPIYPGVTKACTYNKTSDQFIAPVVVIKAGTPIKGGGVTQADTQTGGPVAKPVSIDVAAPATVDTSA